MRMRITLAEEMWYYGTDYGWIGSRPSSWRYGDSYNCSNTASLVSLFIFPLFSSGKVNELLVLFEATACTELNWPSHYIY